MDSSELAARNLAEQEVTSKLESEEIEQMAPEWTDEKHCLFLKSMESTFVNQLYRSIEKFGLQSHKSCSSRSKSLKQKQTSTRTSGQFKVLRDGFWSKVDFEKDEHEYDQSEECKVQLSNPWILRCKNSKIQTNKRCPASSTTDLPPSCEDTNSSNIEGTDQNFNDGALEEEKSSKIDEMKITWSNDQVVPHGNIIQADKIIECHQAPKE